MIALKLKGLEKYLMVKGTVGLFRQCNLEKKMTRSTLVLNRSILFSAFKFLFPYFVLEKLIRFI